MLPREMAESSFLELIKSHVGTVLRDMDYWGLGSTGLVAGLDLKALFQPK